MGGKTSISLTLLIASPLCGGVVVWHGLQGRSAVDGNGLPD